MASVRPTAVKISKRRNWNPSLSERPIFECLERYRKITKIFKAFARTVGSLVLKFNFGFWAPLSLFLCLLVVCACVLLDHTADRHQASTRSAAQRALFMAQLSCRRVAEKCENRARISTASLCCRAVAIDRSRTIRFPSFASSKRRAGKLPGGGSVCFASNPGISAGVELCTYAGMGATSATFGMVSTAAGIDAAAPAESEIS